MSYQIRTASLDQVKLIIDWAAKEGWNPGLYDAECFYAADPQGFFICCAGDDIITAGSAVVYDESFAFCGLYITNPEYRGKGYGMHLTKHGLTYVGQRINGIDGVLGMVDKYAQIGFKYAHKNHRFIINAKTVFIPPINVVDVTTIPLAELLEFDRIYFPAPRQNFLQCWIKQPHSFSLGYIQDGKLAGYGTIRKCIQGYKIGPLFAQSSSIADCLLQSLMSRADAPPFFLDVPEPNINARELISRYKMQEVFATARMYSNGSLNLNLNDIYGVTTFELG